MVRKWMLCTVLLFQFLSLNAGSAELVYPFDSPGQSAQFNGLLKELRCLVCQNQDLADSNAALAKDLREEVYHMVKDGQTDQAIMDYLTRRYGDFILFKPPVKGLTVLLWLGPLLFILLGGTIFWRSIHHRRGQS